MGDAAILAYAAITIDYFDGFAWLFTYLAIMAIFKVEIF
jgi:hypothetical protein